MENKSIHSIYILADSYGGERIHNKTVDVKTEQSYPQLLKKEFNSIQFSIDTASFRKITDFPKIIESVKDEFDLFILQGGIVDCYPRPLSHKMTISQSFMSKAVRKMVRINRSFFIKNIRNRPWSSAKEVEDALFNCFELLKNKKVIFINIAPVNKFQDKQTPNANGSIMQYNMVIETTCSKFKNVQLIDINKELSKNPEMETYLHAVDSHLNVKGNTLYANLISLAIKNAK